MSSSFSTNYQILSTLNTSFCWYSADKARPWAQHDGSHNMTNDGWFCTGDMACIDPHGHVQLTDRTKDVIKSGGEWISSIDLENVAVGHPQVPACYIKGWCLCMPSRHPCDRARCVRQTGTT